ncbi:MAG: hypothetical protein WCS94_14180 [Verrucomicrobiota bacterium]
MSLTLENSGLDGDDSFDFWEIPDAVAHFEHCLEPAEADEFRLLIEDYHRVRRQCSELRKISPAKAEFYHQQHEIAVDAIEKKIKKLLGKQVAYTSSLK